MKIDRVAAKAVGYSDQEIDAFLGIKSQVKEPVKEVAPTLPVKIDTEAAKAAGYTPQEINRFLKGEKVSSYKIEPVDITQTFNQRSPYDVFSGGVNTGVDFATAQGTPVELPEGEWEVEDAFTGASPQGYIGNFENMGYGNSVVVKNRRTGEKLRLSHLSNVNVTPGQVIKGGLIGPTGATGNVTGSHLDAEYYNQQGELADILQSPYANIIPNKRSLQFQNNQSLF